MKNQFLTVVIWIMGIAAVIGNLGVIIKRIRSNQGQRNRQSLFLTHLAIADFMMGIYLMIIAVVDLKWKGEYFKHDILWRSGNGCAIAGVLSMSSSVVSVILLSIITFERLVCVVFPFTFQKIPRAYAYTACIITWIIGLVGAVIPVAGLQEYFYDDEADFGFYGRSSVCLPMQLSPDRYAGWEYAAVFFMLVPFAAFAFMIVAYVTILRQVSSSASKVQSKVNKRETSLSKRVIFIILTDFLCWMPVVILGMLAYTGAFYDPTKQVYVWVAIVILPINSSINPFLYTFTTDLKSSSKKKNTTESKTNAFQCFSNKGTSRSSTHDVIMSRALQAERSEERDDTKRSPQIKYKIKVLEELSIQTYYDGIGYVLAMVDFNDQEECALVKYFHPEKTDIWEKELKILEKMMDKIGSQDGCMGLPKYKWHCSAEEHLDILEENQKVNIQNAALICYGFDGAVESLKDFLGHKELVTIEAVCSLGIDIISTVNYLQECGISNNHINAKSIIVIEEESDQRRAVVVDFSRATDLKQYEDGSFAKTDTIQFDVLLKIMLKHCCQQLNEHQMAQVDEITFHCKNKRTSETTGLIEDNIKKLAEM